MQKKLKNRLLTALLTVCLVSAGISIVLYYLSDNIVFFIKPHEISEQHYGRKIKIGGLVKKDSYTKDTGGNIFFVLRDEDSEIRVRFRGILPALFRENQGIIAEGYLQEGNIFLAERLLTKHDENYKPPNK